MLQYQLAGESASFYVPFIVEGEFATPEIGSVTYTIRDNQGAAISGHTDVSLTTDVNTTSVNIVVPAEVNTKASAVDIRSMTVKFIHEGNSHQRNIRWGLINWINLLVDAVEVRNILGLNEFELQDHDVDMIRAYMDVKTEVSTLDDLLVSGDDRQLTANRLIALKAALTVMPSVQMRANKREKSDAVEFERLSNIKLPELASSLGAEYAGLIGQLTGVAETTPTLFTLSSPTDPVTGA